MTDHCNPIIIVEDNATDAELAQRAIRKWGAEHPIVVIEDGLRAADQLLGDSKKQIQPLPVPKLLILDINLPGLGGIELLSRLRASARHRHTVVVMVSSSAELEDVLNSYRMGCNSYVTKPVNSNTFDSMYAHLAQYWTSINLTPELQNP
jgi:two-component system response regulator